MRLLLFHNPGAALKFIKRHRDQVIQVIIVVKDKGSGNNGSWKGAVKSNYGAVVLSGLILLQEP